jgi:hypothetical protein
MPFPAIRAMDDKSMGMKIGLNHVHGAQKVLINKRGSDETFAVAK